MVLVYSWNINGEPFYIGIGSKQRAYRRGRNPYCNNVRQLAENSDCFEVEILENNLTRKQACEREEYYIRLFGRRDNGTGCLTNLTWGGDGVDTGSTPWNKGKKWSLEMKERLSRKAKERYKDENQKKKNLTHLREVHKKNKGEKRTEDTKQKISKSLKGKPREYMRNHRNGCSSVTTPFGEFYGVRECSRQTGIPLRTLQYRLSRDSFPEYYRNITDAT